MATRKLEVQITGDATQLEKTLGKLSNQAQGFGGAMKKAALPATLALGAVAVGAKKTIDAASNLDEQMNKTAVVFGENGKEVQQWSKNLTKNFGMSQRAALEAAGTYGNMLKPMGILPAKTKEISKRMVELAGDMASFNNASPEETLDALRAGLAGEAEPLRRFGVFLSEAAIQAEAMNSGLVKAVVDMDKVAKQQIVLRKLTELASEAMKKHGKDSTEYSDALVGVGIAESKLATLLEGKVPKLTAAQKAQASYGIIVKSTSDAQGDFAKTSESVANQQRIQAAESENLNAKIGKGLLPVYKQLQQIGLAVTGVIADHTTATKVLVGVAVALAAGILAVNVAMKAWTAATTAATAAQWLWNTALAANPIGVVVIALAALGVAIVVAYQKSETFRKIVDGLWDALKSVGGWMRDNFPKAKAAFMTAIDPMVDKVELFAKAIGKVVDGIRWLIDHIPKIPKMPDIPFVGGDPRDPNMTHPGIPRGGGGIDLRGASPVMMPFAIAAQSLGLSVTPRGGLRPGAITANGTPSDHGIGKALDLAGPASGMAAFFKALLGNPAVKQAFYDPLGSIFGGKWSSYREGGHSDHVHVATYDQGGILRPGLTLAYNGTGRNEYVSNGAGGGDIVIQVDGETLARVNRRYAEKHARRNG